MSNKTSQKNNTNHTSELDAVIDTAQIHAGVQLGQKIDDTLADIKKVNAELEAKYGQYLKDDYIPEGYDAKGLKDKVDEMTDQKEQEDLAQEVDDKIAEIMSEVIDISREEE